jgi:2-polyprenyl-6-methoxyphenol hydroxylase-like FAD-dependent oxidoreductase
MTKKIAVIGGGPIGLYVAIRLANKGYHIDLFEKGNWPRDKVCGQGLMPSAVELLSDVGVNFHHGKDSYIFEGISYHDDKLKLLGKLKEKAYGVKRTTLSQKLFNIAKSNPMISLYDNCQARVVDAKHGSLEIRSEESTSNQDYHYIFACDGLISMTRKDLGMELHRKCNLRVGAREHYELSPWSNNVEVYWADGKELYITPVSKDLIEVAYLWYEYSIQSGANFKERFLDDFPEIQNKIKGVNPRSDFSAYGPFSRYSKKVFTGKVFFLGDAYNFMDGITGEGISLGLKAANIIVNDFESNSLYMRFKIYFLYKHYTLFVSMALTLSRWPKLRRILFTLLRGDSKFFSYLIRFNDL